MRCPKCGEEMQRKGTHAGLRYQCFNEDCPVIGMSARSKFGKTGQLLFSSGHIIYDSTYKDVECR